MLHVANMTTFAKLYDEIAAMLEGTGNIGALQSATEAVIAGGMRDPEGLFMLALQSIGFAPETREARVRQNAGQPRASAPSRPPPADRYRSVPRRAASRSLRARAARLVRPLARSR